MILYELKIEGAFLYYNITVDTSQEYWEDIDITEVRVDTSKTFGSDTPFEVIHPSDDGTLNGRIPISGASDELFILTPKIVNLHEDTPCGMDIPDKGVIYDKDKLIQKGLPYLKELGDTCSVPRSLIDFILRRYALDMSLETCNYNIAVKYWKMLTMVKGTTIKGCGCNGK